MTAQILLIVVPMLFACAVSFMLGAAWSNGRRDSDTDYIITEIEADRVVHFGDQWPKVDR